MPCMTYIHQTLWATLQLLIWISTRSELSFHNALVIVFQITPNAVFKKVQQDPFHSRFRDFQNAFRPIQTLQILMIRQLNRTVIAGRFREKRVHLFDIFPCNKTKWNCRLLDQANSKHYQKTAVIKVLLVILTCLLCKCWKLEVQKFTLFKTTHVSCVHSICALTSIICNSYLFVLFRCAVRQWFNFF